MNKTKIVFFFISFFCFLIIEGCKKDEVVPKTKQELLVGKWKISSYIIKNDPGNVTKQEINVLTYSDLQDLAICLKDDILTVKSTAGDTYVDIGSNSCGLTSGTDTWTISSDGKNITSVYLDDITSVTFEKPTSPIMLVDITETVLTLSRIGTISNPNNPKALYVLTNNIQFKKE